MFILNPADNTARSGVAVAPSRLGHGPGIERPVQLYRRQQPRREPLVSIAKDLRMTYGEARVALDRARRSLRQGD